MELSIVTTLYNSEDYIREFYSVIIKSLQNLKIDCYEIIFVNDGSSDNSLNQVLELRNKDNKVKVIDFSKNYGQFQAIHAGLAYSTGNFTFLIDSDLEENPNLVEFFYNEIKTQENVDVVFGVSIQRNQPIFRKLMTIMFYSIISIFKDSFPINHLTVRIMRRKYILEVLKFEESKFNIFSVFEFAGFNKKSIPVEKNYKGKSSYSLFKLINVAIDSMITVTVKPLYFMFYLSILLLVTVVVLSNLNWKIDPQLTIPFWISIFLVYLGILAVYISKAIALFSNRPSYIVREVYE